MPSNLSIKDRTWKRGAEAGGVRLVHDGVGLDGLIGDGPYRLLQDLALPLSHRRLAIRSASAFAARFSWRCVIRATRAL